MLRKLAVALLAASVFTVPALAQGTAPKSTDKPAAAATATTPKVAAKSTLKSAKARKGHRHVVRVKHVKPAKHVKSASVNGAKHRHVVSQPSSSSGSAAMNSAKPRSGAN
jgi:hypothetical protein